MKYQGDVLCESCGAKLMGTICEYCGVESNYLFLTQDEICNKIKGQPLSRLQDVSMGFDNLLYYSQDYHGHKEVVLKPSGECGV